MDDWFKELSAVVLVVWFDLTLLSNDLVKWGNINFEDSFCYWRFYKWSHEVLSFL